MSYLVLARRWRPDTFERIAGQEHVTRTLVHAIEQDRVHHAFLFCGARGVGKTSAARVLAKALNCNEAEGATPTPCGTCASCQEIPTGSSMDVLEIDGASNRGISEIRELRERVAYAPQRDRYKVYIIDEVHMLTTEAFNALLKTLEEPPLHVKFIFATTEPHRIPVTILSRCQRFDFKRIGLTEMVERLTQILEAESVKLPQEALQLVARESEGSMRDALSLLDRIISFAGDEASFEQVTDLLGVADRAWLSGLVSAALSQDSVAALQVVQDVFEHGVDLKQFSRDLVHYLRDVVVLRVAGTGHDLTDLTPDETRTLVELGQSREIEDLERLFQQALGVAERIAQAPFPRLEMEMAVIRMCRMRPMQALDRIIDRLAALERHLDTGAPLPMPTAVASPRQSQPRPSAPEADDEPSEPAPAPVANVEPEPEAEPEPPVMAAPPEPEPEPPVMAAPPEPEPEPAAPPLELTPPAPEPEPPVMSAPEPEPEPAAPPLELTPPAPEPAPEAPAAQEASVMSPGAEPAVLVPTPQALPLPETFDQNRWERFVEAIRTDAPAFAGNLDHGQVLSYQDGALRVGFSSGGYSVTDARQHHAKLLELLRAHVGPLVSVSCEETDHVESTPFQRRQVRHAEEVEARQQELLAHPSLTAVVERFDGQVRGVEVSQEGLSGGKIDHE
ncbi:MAG: DNA polymerase III subunit gamma/tau [Myxococcota bacterium]|nr:DNA polymerase III subunit gamma/tau [Myxococcota bacterium]